MGLKEGNRHFSLVKGSPDLGCDFETLKKGRQVWDAIF